MLLDLLKVCIRLFRVERFIGPHEGNHIGISEIFDVVCITCRDIHHLNFFSTDVVLYNFSIWIAYLSEANHSSAAHHDELLILGMVPVVAFGDIWLADIDRELSPFWSADHFCKTSSFINVHFERVGELVFR